MYLLNMYPAKYPNQNKELSVKYWTTEEMEAALLWVAFKCKCTINDCIVPDSDEYQGWYILEMCDLAIASRSF